MNERDRILRLLAYKNILFRFKSLGFIRVFSDNIAEALDISSSLVRKDFALYGITGNQKGGYHIDSILEKISDVVGFKQTQEIIIIGVGRIGEALIRYNGFRNSEIKIIAGFDSDVRKVKRDAEVPVLPVEEMTEYVAIHQVRIAIMAVPEAVAVPTFESLKGAGIKGIMNFTPVKIKSSSDLIVTHLNIEHELMNLIFMVNNTQNNTVQPVNHTQ